MLHYLFMAGRDLISLMDICFSWTQVFTKTQICPSLQSNVFNTNIASSFGRKHPVIEGSRLTKYNLIALRLSCTVRCFNLPSTHGLLNPYHVTIRRDKIVTELYFVKPGMEFIFVYPAGVYAGALLCHTVVRAPMYCWWFRDWDKQDKVRV